MVKKGWDKESARHSMAKKFGKAPPYRKKAKTAKKPKAVWGIEQKKFRNKKTGEIKTQINIMEIGDYEEVKDNKDLAIKDLSKGAWRKEFGYSQDTPRQKRKIPIVSAEDQKIEDEYYAPTKGKLMAEIQADLVGFTGTERYHQGWAGVKWTDGVAYFAKKYGGWLITDISSYWVEPDVRKEEFQVWTLTVDADKKGVLKMTDGNSKKAIKTQKYNYVDLPAGELKFYLQQGVLMLPREY